MHPTADTVTPAAQSGSAMPDLDPIADQMNQVRAAASSLLDKAGKGSSVTDLAIANEVAKLSGVTLFSGAGLYGTAWWEAKSINRPLLDYLAGHVYIQARICVRPARCRRRSE